MATLVDTYKLASQLKSRGFSEGQARGVSEAIQEIDLSQMVTKRDLEVGLRELELRMTVKMGAMVMALAAFLVALKYFS